MTVPRNPRMNATTRSVLVVAASMATQLAMTAVEAWPENVMSWLRKLARINNCECQIVPMHVEETSAVDFLQEK